jgi:hypothetical protein
MEKSVAYLMVALPKSFDAQTVPAVLVIEHFGGLQSNFDVPTFQGQAEASLFVLHKVKSHLIILAKKRASETNTEKKRERMRNEQKKKKN